MLDSLENKFRLATIAPLDRRMKRKHLAVYGFLLDWYHRKYGDALASVRHIVAQLKERDPAGLGLYTGDVHSALKDLEAWGYITADIGIGRRASRYVPVWVHGSSVHKTPNTTEDEISVRENQNTSVRETPNTTSDSVHEIQNEDPLTVTRSLDPGTQIEGDDCASATPPPTVGLGATVAGNAQEGFEELWKTYFPKRGQGDKKKARVAYAALAPSADLHASLLDSAKAWFEAWRAQEKPDAPRKHLDTWLKDEHYECEPPTAYKPRERKARDQAAAEASNDNEPETGIPATEATDKRVYRHVVIDDIKPRDGGGYHVRFSFKDCAPGDAQSTHQFYTNDEAMRLLSAVGVVVAKPNDELKSIGRPALLIVDQDDRHDFEPLFRSDEHVEISYDPIPKKERPSMPRKSLWKS
ncbi:hypothetical protein [Agrobacterium larrymoorei]|uniref:Uncharacterized protein n=1 Tax=Agrobacterium larrymoorei TaxID=160699 RepID=A0AAF0H7Y9_9HYPH|nr:hypothetical protein [Agrobacterium larrymoorei]WHA40567.1 hypothetical protein CFBP5477_012155 [Agrobacterium larrymoorei]